MYQPTQEPNFQKRKFKSIKLQKLKKQASLPDKDISIYYDDIEDHRGDGAANKETALSDGDQTMLEIDNMNLPSFISDDDTSMPSLERSESYESSLNTGILSYLNRKRSHSPDDINMESRVKKGRSENIQALVNERKRKATNTYSVHSKRRKISGIHTAYQKPYHYWLNGERVDLQRQRHDANYFTEELTNLPKASVIQNLEITYTNLQWQKVRLSTENMFETLVDTYPCTKIFPLVELRWTVDSHSVAPTGWRFITHEDLEQKNTGFLIHDSIKITEVITEKNVTEITIENEDKSKMRLISIYRCPTMDQDIYRKLLPGESRAYMKYYEWMVRLIENHLSRATPTMIFMDANIDLTRAPQNILERRAQNELKHILTHKWSNLLEGEITFQRGNSQSSIDWILTNDTAIIEGIRKEPYHETVGISDHFLFSVKMSQTFRKPRARNAVVKSKVPKLLSHEEKMLFVKQANDYIKSKRIYETLELIENDMVDWNGKELYLEGEELPEPEFIRQYGIISLLYKRKRMKWREIMKKRLKVIQEASDQLLPMKEIIIEPLGNHINRNISVRKAIKERSDYLTTRGITGSGHFHNRNNRELRRLNKKVRDSQKKARFEHWNARLSNQSSTANFWHLFKEYKNKTETNPDWFTKNGVAQAFHDLSWNYQPKYAPHPEWINGENEKFDFGLLNNRSQNYYENTEKLLKDGKGSKYCYSVDNVTWDMLRYLNSWFWDYQTQIYNEIFKTGCYPESFRIQKMTALKKKPTPLNYKQYRPVSVSSQATNNVEKILCLKYYRYAEEIGKFHWLQFGFRAHFSIGYLLSELRKTIARREEGLYGILLTDLSNAFGSPDTEIVLKEFQKGLTERSYKLMKSFLIQSKGCLKHDGDYAKTFTGTPRGFSQGSKFSPTAFVTMMTVVHEVVKAVCFSFADDANFKNKGHQEDDLKKDFEKTLEEFDGVCDSKNMPLNVSKGSYLTNLGKNLHIIYCGQEVPFERSTCMLGFRMTETTGHNPQVLYVRKQAVGTTHMVRGFGRYVTEPIQGRMVGSYDVGLFSHSNAYDYKWTKSQYRWYQVSLNKILQKRSGWVASRMRNTGKSLILLQRTEFFVLQTEYLRRALEKLVLHPSTYRFIIC